MHRKMLLLGTALSLSFAAGAAANERHGWYMGLEAGWVHVNDTEMPNWFYQDIQFENRWGALGTVGFAFNGNWRMELEAGYRNNDVHQITFGGERGPLIEGDLTEWTGMLNALYNQPVGQRWSIDFGVGVGVDDARYSDIISPGVRTESSDAVFAAQGILGLSYRVGPHWDVMLNYRYLWADEPELTNFGGETDTMDMTKHTVTLGFRWGYDDVAPPPPPPPPPPLAATVVLLNTPLTPPTVRVVLVAVELVAALVWRTQTPWLSETLPCVFTYVAVQPTEYSPPEIETEAAAVSPVIVTGADVTTVESATPV